MDDREEWSVDYENAYRFELRIEHGEFVTWNELQEIVTIIDDFIKGEAYQYLALRYPEFEYRYLLGRRSRRGQTDLPDAVSWQLLKETSFVTVESADRGSIILGIVIGGVIGWPLWAIGAGVKRSRMRQQLVRLGQAAGNIAADHIEPINERLESWSSENRRLRGKKTTPKFKALPREPFHKDDLDGQ